MHLLPSIPIRRLESNETGSINNEDDVQNSNNSISKMNRNITRTPEFSMELKCKNKLWLHVSKMYWVLNRSQTDNIWKRENEYFFLFFVFEKNNQMINISTEEENKSFKKNSTKKMKKGTTITKIKERFEWKIKCIIYRCYLAPVAQ